MLRVLAVVGPAQARPVAGRAADRLAAAGLQDPPWVKGLGAPQVGECFGYTDGAGVQEAFAVTFAYGRRQHALAVLVDHEIGGGVKDCWPTDRPDLIRADYQQAAKRYGLNFRDYAPAEARAVLDRALRRPPCPVTPHQAEDVRDYLELLRLRAALLPVSGKPGRHHSRAGGATVHRVKITLRGSRPPIWRRLEVPSRITLRRLHEAIQAAFGWDNRRRWLFDTPVGAYGVADREQGHRSAQSKRLEDVAPRARDLIYYTYGSGDGGKHQILIEEVRPAEPGVAYPRCLTGRRSCPPVDDGFDPATFDVDEANAALSGLARVLVP
jgi:hypothetical protein